MAEYKRYISYVYIYKNGVKENNIGFVKLESKAGNVKITLSIKCNEIKKNNLKIYLFYRSIDNDENNDINLIHIDDVYCDNDEYSRTYRTNAENVFESSKDISIVAGLIVLLEGYECIGTEWDDKGIDVMRIKQNKKEQIVKKEDVEPDVILNLNKFNESKVIHKGNNSVEKTKIETSNSQSDIVTKQVNNQARKIFASFPGMYPFEDDEIKECVKLEPNDIGVFSMDKWPLANNSFLLHGYYTYRHLIFARMKHNNIYKYILGVPGIFRDRERFMASMFGFKSFKGVRNKPLCNGEFGYWYLEIKL